MMDQLEEIDISNPNETNPNLVSRSSSPKLEPISPLSDPHTADDDHQHGNLHEAFQNLDCNGHIAERLDLKLEDETEPEIHDHNEEEGKEKAEAEAEENGKSVENGENGDERDHWDESEKVVGVNEFEKKNERRRYMYPVRPEAEDCAFFVKTGVCKFGSNCKFNHPVRRRNQAAKEKKEKEEQTENPSQTECKYYLRTGGCKYGSGCKYNHSKANGLVVPVVELNFLGLPIRPGEKECPYYMRTGSCKYGATCRFNHPDPTAVGGGGGDSLSGYDNGGSISSQAVSQAPWSSTRPLNGTTSYLPMMIPPTQGGTSRSPEWNGYQAPIYHSERSLPAPKAYAMNNPVTETGAYQSPILVDDFPERSGQPECSYFMKTGDCKFKSNCKYSHPKSRIVMPPPCILSDKGLPLRPDQNICTHYSRYGICKFGPACKYDHPAQLPAQALDHPPVFSNSAATTTEEARLSESGGSIQQPV